MDRFIKLETKPLAKLQYIYLDHVDFVMDNVFIRNQIPVTFMQEYAREDSSYLIVRVEIEKKYKEKFEQSFNEAENTMLLLGHADYPEAYEKYWVNGIKKDY